MSRPLSHEQKTRIHSVARKLAYSDTPLPNATPNHFRGIKLRNTLIHIGGKAITEWGDTLPDPRVSLELLEAIAQRNRYIAQLAARITVDSYMGCWSLPLTSEYDANKVARYPNVNFSDLDMKCTSGHRFTWKLLVEPHLQRNDHLDHLCRSHACCNPTHLEPVPPKVNTQRGNHARERISGQDMLF